MVYNGIECELVINNEPAEINIFDKDGIEYRLLEVYLTDFKAVKELPLLEKIVWLFFDKFSSYRSFGCFPACYLRIGIDEISDIFQEDMGDIDRAIQSLISKGRLQVYDESDDKMLAYAAS